MRTIGTLVLALLTRLGRALSAQTAIDTARAVGTIDGIVRDTAFVPLARPSVKILSTSVPGTGASGRFRIVRVPAGQYPMIVRHLGHRPPSGREAYAGPATIPPQFAGGRSSCGVVLSRTRYGT